MATQFRDHLFTVIVLGDSSRIIRWDRGGAIVTEAFNYTQRKSILFEYFKRFRQLDGVQRGINPNVLPATKANARMARERLNDYTSELWLGRAADALRDMVDIETQPFLQLQFQGKTWVIPSPHCDDYGLSPFGRASRARIAVEVESETAHYVKDSWRNRDPNRLPESEVYKILAEKKVKFIAEMACGGDTGHEVQSYLWKSKPWVWGEKLRIRDLVGHIIILKTVGRSLMTFRTARQFLTCLANGMEGYEDALAKAQIMHRDISTGNILMVKDPGSVNGWKGVIIDWDHHVRLDVNRTLVRITRTGAWQFMSAYLALNPTAEHSPVDDRESALHVLIWISLRHLKHAGNSIEILQPQLNVFDQMMFRSADGQPVNTAKVNMILGGLTPNIKFDLEPINELILKLRTSFATRYAGPSLVGNVGLDEGLLQFYNKCKKDVETPDWLFTEIYQAAEQLPARGGTDADWVDNTRELAELSRQQGNGEAFPLIRCSRPWLGYTRSVHYPDINPAMESQPSQRARSGSENRVQEEEDRYQKRRRV
ncbi:hypothetical protein NLJ89_g8869 [Agrocybe chaxingu]|uniref:Fungal-type protein kinase domain-containing protein n=1 Tax=Agrocybe chaxingu TaxID=84603 RepID=A0A9W8JUE3_9AGAR|nr:hypothetical protein NLJ89_g8869 [Agrocybe chaxingu]